MEKNLIEDTESSKDEQLKKDMEIMESIIEKYKEVLKQLGD